MLRKTCRAVWLCALSLCFACSIATGQEVEFLDQNWDDETRQFFYTVSQGSRLLPYDWFMALELKDKEEPLAGDHLLKLGFLKNVNAATNPDELPVGFALDVDWTGQKYLGLNCAACHTNQIRFGDKTLQIDGAPSLADIWGLLEGVGQSLEATGQDQEKWARFSRKVLGDDAPSSDATRLKQEFTAFTAYYTAFIGRSRTEHPWGRGRLDAFGMIFNRVASIDLGIPENSAPPDAPVSYPFLWGTSWENRVQWNGSAPNTNDIERLGRNIGEVLGVFAQADLERASIFKPYYRTSARRLNQVRIENRLKKLWSPAWPQEIVDWDMVKLEKGRRLFADHCIHCHEIVPHGEQNRPVAVAMTPLSEVQTDPKMATNAATRVSQTGRLEGSKLPGLDSLPAEIATGALLQNVVRGALLSPFRDVDGKQLQLDSLENVQELIARLESQRINDEDIAAFLDEIDLSQEQVLQLVKQFEAKLHRYVNDLRVMTLEPAVPPDSATESVLAAAVEATRERVLAYKARPLDGIWATAPYLHNGSVPNLYELLLPAEERSKKFHVGSTEFDPIKVGFRTEEAPGTSLFDTTLPGNSNAGHDSYGDFTDEERWALVEYMKSL